MKHFLLQHMNGISIQYKIEMNLTSYSQHRLCPIVRGHLIALDKMETESSQTQYDIKKTFFFCKNDKEETAK